MPAAGILDGRISPMVGRPTFGAALALPNEVSPFTNGMFPILIRMLAFISLLTSAEPEPRMRQHRLPWPRLSRGRGARGAIGSAPAGHSIATPRCRRQDRRRNAEERPSVQETTVARPASRPAWLIDSADFWRLWFVGLVVFVVRWVETVAVGVFVYQHTGSAFIVAMMTMLRLLPMGLFGAFIGAIAERMERRTTLIVVVASMVITSLALAILAHLHLLAVWHLARRQLHQRRRLGDRQSGAAGDDRRGGRRRADGHRDVARCRRQQRQPHGGADDRRPAARQCRHRRRVHAQRRAVRGRRGGGVPRALSEQLPADHSGFRARTHRRGIARWSAATGG